MRRSGPIAWLVPLSAFGAVLAMAAARAWTSDDAFITFRVAEQWVAGHGPVFNAGERVQVFTHPLWLLLLTAWRWCGASLFPGAMALSVAVFAAGLAALFWTFRDKPLALATCATLLFFSRTVVDFASGGLETPLSFALFAFSAAALRAGRPRAALAFLVLLPLNRLDLLPWAAPFAWLAAEGRMSSRARALAWLCAPAFAYAVFATIYYGSPLPNTANAKLAESAFSRLDEGLGYVVASLAVDPGSIGLVIAGVVAATLRLARARTPGIDERLAGASLAAAGVAFAYAIWAGGDFMLGRFLLPGLWALALAWLASFPANAPEPRSVAWTAKCLALLALLVAVGGSSTTQLWIGLDPESPRRYIFRAGAIDERRNYIPWFGAFSPRPLPRHADEPLIATPRVLITLGWGAYYGKLPQPYVDFFALSDPLLARTLPVGFGRPGHGVRPWPREFWRWREEGHRFGDARLDALAADLRLAHLQPDLFDAKRFAAIVRLVLAAPIDSGALTVTREPDAVVFDLDPAMFFRPYGGAAAYAVWLRLFDEARVEPPVRMPVALDESCHPYAVEGSLGDTHAIVVPASRRLRLTCPRTLLADAPIAMRVGAAMDMNSPFTFSGDIVALSRPPGWWLDAIPVWLTQGWRERPRPALAQAALLAIVAAALAMRARRREKSADAS